MKHSAGFGEAQAVKVVGNGEGGPKRVWKPATRRGGNAAPGSGFPGLGAPKRRRTPWEEVRDGGMAIVGHTASADGCEAEVLEGARKARSGIQVDQVTGQSAASRKTPGSTPQGRRAQAEPGSRTNGYGRQSNAEGRRNAAEDRVATDQGKDGEIASAVPPDRTRHRATSSRGSRYSGGDNGD
jgi:hypothetical protein